MGIQNLLPNLKSIQNEAPCYKYKNKKIAIDSYSWLHKGIFNCSTEIIKNGELSTNK
jgi:exonuclease-1